MPDGFEIDLAAYAERIGIDGELEPTIEVLRKIAIGHATSIPFEHLSILQKVPIQLGPAELEDKLVRQKRGGYCFEQNGLMLQVLQQIGFAVSPLAGRVRLESPRTVLPPRTHLFLSVEIDGQNWFFDVGVGGYSLTAPIRWVLDEPQETPHETRRIIEEDGKYFHQVWTGSIWQDVYEFSGEAMPEIDRQVANWWTSTNPTSKFSQNLFVAIAQSDGTRKGLANRKFLHRRGPEVLREAEINSADALLEILSTEFGLHFPPGTRFGSGERAWPTE